MVIYMCIIYLIVINLVVFLIFGIDKKKAVKHEWRITERSLILLAAVGGSIGALVGMKAFRHKTKHSKFYIGIPVLLVLHIVVAIYIIYQYNLL